MVKREIFYPKTPEKSVYDLDIDKIISNSSDKKSIHTNPNYIVLLLDNLRLDMDFKLYVLPFCHTLESEFLGADIVFDEGWKNPRTGEYICNSMEEVLDILTKSYNNISNLGLLKALEEKHDSRLISMVKAIKILKDREDFVSFELSGPFTVLNSLVDLKVVYKSMIKNKKIVEKVFFYLEKILLEISYELIKVGVDVISLSDSPGDMSLLGEKRFFDTYEFFWSSFLKCIFSKSAGNTTVFLCPMLSRSLVEIGVAKYVKLSDIDSVYTDNINDIMDVEDILIKVSKKKIGFVSGFCFSKKYIAQIYGDTKILEILD